MDPLNAFLPLGSIGHKLDGALIPVEIVLLCIDEGTHQEADEVSLDIVTIGHQRDFVRFTVSVGILIAEGAQHLCEVIRRHRFLHSQLLQPRLIDHHAALGIAVVGGTVVLHHTVDLAVIAGDIAQLVLECHAALSQGVGGPVRFILIVFGSRENHAHLAVADNIGKIAVVTHDDVGQIIPAGHEHQFQFLDALILVIGKEHEIQVHVQVLFQFQRLFIRFPVLHCAEVRNADGEVNRFRADRQRARGIQLCGIRSSEHQAAHDENTQQFPHKNTPFCLY